MNITDWAALAVAIVSLGIAIFKTRPEARALDGNAAQSYSEAAGNYAKQVIDLQNRLTSAEEKLVTLDKRVSDRDAIISEWSIGIERLCGQVVSLGHVPVWRPKERGQ